MIHNSEDFKIQTIQRVPKSILMFLRRESKFFSAQNYSHSAHGDTCCQSNQTKNNEPEVIITVQQNLSVLWFSHCGCIQGRKFSQRFSATVILPSCSATNVQITEDWEVSLVDSLQLCLLVAGNPCWSNRVHSQRGTAVPQSLY